MSLLQKKKRNMCTPEPLAMQGLDIRTPKFKHVKTIEAEVHVLWHSYR